MPDRWICFQRFYPESRPWVLFECQDEGAARDGMHYVEQAVLMRREDALLDPDYRDALRAWESKDDSAYGEDMAREDAEMALEESVHDAEVGLAAELQAQGMSKDAAFLEAIRRFSCRPTPVEERIASYSDNTRDIEWRMGDHYHEAPDVDTIIRDAQSLMASSWELARSSLMFLKSPSNSEEVAAACERLDRVLFMQARLLMHQRTLRGKEHQHGGF